MPQVIQGTFRKSPQTVPNTTGRWQKQLELGCPIKTDTLGAALGETQVLWETLQGSE